MLIVSPVNTNRSSRHFDQSETDEERSIFVNRIPSIHRQPSHQKLNTGKMSQLSEGAESLRQSDPLIRSFIRSHRIFSPENRSVASLTNGIVQTTLRSINR